MTLKKKEKKKEKKEKNGDSNSERNENDDKNLLTEDNLTEDRSDKIDKSENVATEINKEKSVDDDSDF